MKTYFALLVAAGLAAVAIDGCSSDDDNNATTSDGGLDGSTIEPGDDDLEDGGVCETTVGSTLTQCDCNPVGSVNADKPICGCAGVTGQIGTGPQVGAVGGKFVSGAIDATGGRLVMGVVGVQGGSLWTVRPEDRQPRHRLGLCHR